MDHPLPLLTFSHLAWDSVFQRPHHVMTRLAARRPVLVVEEPVLSREPRLDIRQVAPGVRVCRLHLPGAGAGFHDRDEATLAPLLREHLRQQGWHRFAAWLYTPMAVRIARALSPAALIYDCMDELSAFLLAPPELIERERELLSVADAVFTGGPSLYRAKQQRHPFVLCFPSSVDRAHFARAGAEPADQADLPRPRLGFYGVIDERMDLDLIERVADARPAWQIVMIGPVVKIDEARLPRRPNLHYLGKREYRDLPDYLAGWDVSLMPFAINEATRFISPTKVLEYMAAGRPIVTTPITDVVEPYGDIMQVGSDPASFVEGCEQALHETPAQRERRLSAMDQVLRNTSWDAIVDEMSWILDTLTREVPDRGATAAAELSPWWKAIA